MQIATTANPVLSPLLNAAAAPDAQARATTDSKRAQAAPAPVEERPAPAVEDSGDVVSVSAAARSPEAADVPAPVYAEIWKGAVKMAQVDIHGHVVSLNGMVASGGGGSLAGPLLAAQRAVQVAQQVGGEIRSAGQSLDRQTLLMRARLATTYGG